MTTQLFTIVASLLVANVSAQNNWVYKCNLCYSEERDIGELYSRTGQNMMVSVSLSIVMRVT
jgi:hypothetical protein